MRAIDQFFLAQVEPNKSCLLELRSMILGTDRAVTESLKWGMPCYSYKNKMWCFLWTDKKTKEPYVLFVEGALLSHPNLEQGKRARMKIFRVPANDDIPIGPLSIVLQNALELYKSGKINTK